MKIYPKAYKIWKRIFSKDFEDFAKVAKFRQIWSLCDTNENVMRRLQQESEETKWQCDQ